MGIYYSGPANFKAMDTVRILLQSYELFFFPGNGQAAHILSSSNVSASIRRWLVRFFHWGIIALCLVYAFWDLDVELFLSVVSNYDMPAMVVATAGDLDLLSHKMKEAKEHYIHAWTLIADNPDLIKRVFGMPVWLYPKPTRYYIDNFQHDSTNSLYATYEFSVNKKGKPTNITLVDTNVPRYRLGEIKQLIEKQFRFRPRFVDGNPVSTDGITIRQPLAFRPAEPSLKISVN